MISILGWNCHRRRGKRRWKWCGRSRRWNQFMHEMSIIESLLDAVREEQRAYPDSFVKTVCVRVGSLRQVVPEIMEFCYTAATRDTALADSRLEIEEIAARAQCGDCGAEFAVDERWFECPQCRQIGA